MYIKPNVKPVLQDVVVVNMMSTTVLVAQVSEKVPQVVPVQLNTMKNQTSLVNHVNTLVLLVQMVLNVKLV
jgi:hypothetical protein